MKKDLLLSVALTIATLFLLVTCNNGTNTIDVGPVHETLEEEEPIVLEYNLPVDSFRIEEHKVKRNQNLSHILIPLGISAKTIDQIAKKKDEFDVRKIRAGNKYKLFFSNDSAKNL